MNASSEANTPTLHQVVLDCEDARALAEFYRQLLGFHYRPGDEPPADGTPDIKGEDWLVLRDATGALPPGFPAGAVSARPDLAGGPPDHRCCTSIPRFQPWRTCTLSMIALLPSGRACSSTDPTMSGSRCTSLQTLQGTPFASSWLRNWVRRGVLDS
jgi:hypothetical protein